jgi:(p)ppGpp synthase/HD superfamily hydrolase
MSDIVARHQKQLAKMQGFLSGKGWHIAADALEFVRSLMVGTRKDGETPEFHHQLSIAKLVRTLTPHLIEPEVAMAAAFLHDLLEDYGHKYTREYLVERFGARIAEVVWRLTKKYQGNVKPYDEYFAALAECPSASVIKLADRAHNLQTMQGVFTLAKQQAYLNEVRTWFLPLNRNARRAFPRQQGAYENLKIVLHIQKRLLESLHEAHSALEA